MSRKVIALGVAAVVLVLISTQISFLRIGHRYNATAYLLVLRHGALGDLGLFDTSEGACARKAGYALESTFLCELALIAVIRQDRLTLASWDQFGFQLGSR